MATHPPWVEKDWRRGRACYFPRDLSHGKYGTDVYCLQAFLRRRGFLKAQPTGFFGQKTEDALNRWRAKQQPVNAGSTASTDGVLGPAEREAYARAHGMPLPGHIFAPTEQPRSKQSKSAQPEQWCVRSYEGDGISSATRCVRDERLLPHACLEACQIAYGDALDKVVPPDEPDQFQRELGKTGAVCLQDCASVFASHPSYSAQSNSIDHPSGRG